MILFIQDTVLCILLFFLKTKILVLRSNIYLKCMSKPWHRKSAPSAPGTGLLKDQRSSLGVAPVLANCFALLTGRSPQLALRKADSHNVNKVPVYSEVRKIIPREQQTWHHLYYLLVFEDIVIPQTGRLLLTYLGQFLQQTSASAHSSLWSDKHHCLSF